MILLACILTALSIGLLAWTIVDIVFRPRTASQGDGRFEIERRNALRAANATYRHCEPLIDELNDTWKFKDNKLAEIEDCLKAAGVREPWKPAEYLNTKRIEGFFIGVSSFLIGSTILGFSLFGAVFFSGLVFVTQQWLAVRTLKSQAVIRQIAMKRRFASAIDLMALMMEVGAGFGECLDVAARENKNNPLGEELGLVQKEISMGALRGKALAGLAERTRDPDMCEVILSINEGEELGTPLTAILRNQADQMRQKRSQWAEKAAAESQVAIVFPAMLIMLACLLIVVAPFVVTVISGGE